MKLQISLKIQYPDGPVTEARPYGTRNIEDKYEQSIEVEDDAAQDIMRRVIKAFNGFDQ